MILILKKAIHKACGYSLDLVSSFDPKQNKQIFFYRRKDCTEKFSKDLKEHATKVTNFKEKEMMPSTDTENKFYEE